MEKVAIIILNYNGKKNLERCLYSLQKIKIKKYHCQILVIDNHSTDSSPDLIQKRFGKIKLIVNPENFGFAKGNNIGIGWALKNSFDYVCLLNNDTVVADDFLFQLINTLKKDKKIGVLSPKIYFASGFEYHKNRYKKSEKGKVIWYAGGIIDWNNVLTFHRGVDEVDRGQYNQEEKTDFATGCCMLIKKEVFQKIGFLDEKYFLYFEDVDFCQRAKKAGFKIFYSPQAVVWHKNAGSSAVGSNLHDYYLTRNRLLFGFKYAGFKTRICLLKEAIKILLKGREKQKKAVRDFFMLRFGKEK